MLNLRAQLARFLREPRTLAVYSALILLLWIFGGPLGRLTAICLTPRLLRPTDVDHNAWTPRLDILLALVAAIGLALLCQYVWGPSVIQGGETTASDTGEHFWMLHTLSNPGWKGWSINRYPLPALFARVFAFGGTPHDTWYRAAIVSMGLLGASIYLWGRAISGIGAGLAAVLMVGAFPDLILMVRTVTGYPEQIAAWTFAAGTAAYALRFPSLFTCLAAGVGAALVFASDVRGLFMGLATLAISLIAAVSTKGIGRRVLRLAAVVLPVIASWMVYHQLPLQVRGLEQMLEASVEASYRRVGATPPPRVHLDGGYNWGKSGPMDLPSTFRALLASRERMNPKIALYEEQKRTVERRVFPYVLSVIVLGLAALLIGPGLPRWSHAKNPRAWLEWLDWRGRLGLLPIVGFLVIWANAVMYEYSERYVALGAPALVILVALGIVALSGAKAPAWSPLVVAFLILYLVPGPLSVRAFWRTPAGTPHELVECLALAKEDSDKEVEAPVRMCVEAQRMPLTTPVAWPF